jgi:hypothetical protein
VWTEHRRLGEHPIVSGPQRIKWAGIAWGAGVPEAEVALGIITILMGLPPLILLPASASPLAGVLNAVFGVALLLIGVLLLIDSSFGFRLRRARRQRGS